MIYNHTQRGTLMIYVIVGMVLLFGYILSQTEFDPVLLGTMVFIILVVGSFSSLTVEIDETHLKIKFGYGIFRKKFTLSEIASAKAVKHHWYLGWGIRFCPWPRMWIFNVSGFDAIDLKMKNGKTYRIGTDDPQMLEQAILQSVNKLL